MSFRRSVRLACCFGSLVALAGCQLTIPNGLLTGANVPGGTAVKPATPADKGGVTEPGKPEPVDADGAEDTGASTPGFPGTGTITPAKPGRATRPPMPPNGGGNLIAVGGGTLVGKIARPYPGGDCKSDFVSLDMDGSGALGIEEFVSWTVIAPGPVACVQPMPMPAEEVEVQDDAMMMGRPAIRPAIEPAVMPCEGDGSGPHGNPKDLFRKFDQDASGQMDPGEFCTIHDALVGGTAEPPPPPDGGPCDAGFYRADQNQDGKVDPKEYVQADYHNPAMMTPGLAGPAVMPSEEDLLRRFKAYDLDASGTLDPKEWCVAGQQPPDVDPPQPAEGCADGENDTSGDGLIDWGEYFQVRVMRVKLTPEGAARFKEQTYLEFKKADASGDGFLDVRERCGEAPQPVDGGCGETFKPWDADYDGQLSPEEYMDGKWSEIRFFKAPTPEEEKNMRASFYSEFKMRDRNGDARLSYDEFVASCN